MPTNIEKLKTCKNVVTDIFSSEAKDDLYDNGNLTTLTEIIKYLESVIKLISERPEA